MHAPSDHPDGDPERLSLRTAISLGAILATRSRTGRGHAVVVADDAEMVKDRAVLEGDFTIEHAVGWAAGYHRGASGPIVVLASLVEHCVECIDPITGYEYERTAEMFAAIGMELRDWVIDDGWVMRSMAYTWRPERAWLGDPPGIRRQRLDLPDPGLLDTDGLDHPRDLS